MSKKLVDQLKSPLREAATDAPSHIPPIDKRRIKLLHIDQAFLAQVLNWWRSPPHWLALPITDQLPEDCEVISVHVSFERRCFEAIVASKEFPVCSPGCQPPLILDYLTEFRQVEFKTAKKTNQKKGRPRGNSLRSNSPRGI